MSLEIEPQLAPVPTARQQRAIDTNGIDTIGNRIDAVSLLGAIPSVPRMDTWLGIAVAALAYSSDLYDGGVSRHFGVDSKTLQEQFGIESKVGEKVDAGGDKAKLFYALPFIWKNDQAPKPVLIAVAAQNLVTMAITAADGLVKKKGEPKIEVSKDGKKAALWQSGGIGLSVIGTKVAETRPVLGKAIRWAGAGIALRGLFKYGIPSTKGYLQEFKKGTGLN